MAKLWKRGVSLLLAAAVMLMAGACNNNGGETSSGGESSGGGSSSGSGVVNEYGWEVPEETLEFSAYCGVADPVTFQEDLDKCDDMYGKFLKEKFNVVIHKEVYLDECTQRLNLMLNSGDYPDLITHATEPAAQAFVDSDAALELTDLLNNYGKDILTEVGEYLPMFQEENGEIYIMPAGYGFKVDTVGYSFSMRYDWWKELNTEMYTTPEEYYQQIKQVVANHPTNEDGQKVYALSDYDLYYMLDTLQGAWGFYDDYALDDDNNMVYWMFDDRAQEIAKYINRFWTDGLIDPDFITHDYDSCMSVYVNDRVAGNLGMWWVSFVFGHEHWQQEDPNTPIEKRFMNATVTAPGVEHQTLSNVNFINTSDMWLITDACENPEALMKYLNWESGPWGTLLTYNGVPGDTNVYDIDGNKIVMKEEALDASNKNNVWHTPHQESGAGNYLLVARRSALAKGNMELPYELDPRVEDSFGVGEAYPLTEDKSKYLDEGWNICWENYDDSQPYNLTPFAVTIPADDPMYVVKQNTDEIAKTEWINIVTADSEANALAALEAAKSKLEQAGIHDLEKYRTEKYQANMELLGLDTLWVDNQRIK
ncbi:MAG: hypothetical protein ACLU62_09540 [Hydrogeniiclostridium sp.]